MSVVHGCPLSAIGPSLLLLPVLGTVCPNTSRPHPLRLFSEVASRLSSSGVPSHDFYCNFCSACAVTVVIFGHFNRSFYTKTVTDPYLLMLQVVDDISVYIHTLVYHRLHAHKLSTRVFLAAVDHNVWWFTPHGCSALSSQTVGQCYSSRGTGFSFVIVLC